MARILKVGKKVNAKREMVKELMEKGFGDNDREVKIELIKELIPIGLMYVEELLNEEVEELAGRRYQREGNPGYVRWGRQWGSIYLSDQKVPVKYPRVRDSRKGKEVKVSSYRKLQEAGDVEDKVLKRVLLGLGCRRYEEASSMIPAAFGLSKSAVSGRFIRASSRKLRDLMERDLGKYDIAAMIIDGKKFKEDNMIIAIGITSKGDKVMLGFVQAGTENEAVIREFLEGLIERGLNIEEGILCIIDGSKGLKKGIEGAFGKYALVQRCQWHKRKNVLEYLPKSKRDVFKSKMQNGYEKAGYEEAKGELLKIRKELAHINESAVKSLDEGFEESLTLHRLGLFKKLGKSLKTTNCIESVMSQIGQKTDKVDNWKNSNQKHRWLAAALLDIEPRLNKISGHRYMMELKKMIQQELGIKKDRKRKLRVA